MLRWSIGHRTKIRELESQTGPKAPWQSLVCVQIRVVFLLLSLRTNPKRVPSEKHPFPKWQSNVAMQSGKTTIQNQVCNQMSRAEGFAATSSHPHDFFRSRAQIFCGKGSLSCQSE